MLHFNLFFLLIIFYPFYHSEQVPFHLGSPLPSSTIHDATSQESGFGSEPSGMTYGKIVPGLHWDAVLWRPWEELTSPLAQRPRRRPQVVGRSDSYWASAVKTTPVPAGLCCECIAPVAPGTISGVPAQENSALWLPWDHRTLKQFFTGSRCSGSGRRNSGFYQLGVVLK